MSLRVAIQTGALDTADVESNTSFALLEAAQAQDMLIFEYAPENLSYNQGRITALARPV
ncbi:MAG: glutathione synthase, partial [Henriciella sp.]